MIEQQCITTVEQFNVRTHNGIIYIENPETQRLQCFRVKRQTWKQWRAGERLVQIWKIPDFMPTLSTRNWFTFGAVEDGAVRPFKSILNGSKPLAKQTEFERMHSAGKLGRRVWQVYARMIEDPARYIAKGYRYTIDGQCRMCNALLTNPDSCRLGIGPVCAKKEPQI